ncbi:MAG: IS66-like element ISArch14 family transposase, partial [Gemmatimonadaceae bacterium]
MHARVLDRAQSYDLPPVVLTVTEHRRMAVTCAHCGHESAAQFPLDVTPGVQYGSEIKSLSVALHSYH